MCCLQLSGKPEDLLSLDYYMRKTFFKTASLMANSCKAIALLAGQTEAVCQQAWEYGRHLGLAFQVKHCLCVLSVFRNLYLGHGGGGGGGRPQGEMLE